MFQFNFNPPSSSSCESQQDAHVPSPSSSSLSSPIDNTLLLNHDTNNMSSWTNPPSKEANSVNLEFLNIHTLTFPSQLSTISSSSDGNVLFSMESLLDIHNNKESNLNNIPINDRQEQYERTIIHHVKRIQISIKNADRMIQDHQKQKQKQNEGSSLVRDTAINSPKVLDVIPGFYEGGLKVWECSLDLCRYLRNEIIQAIQLQHSLMTVSPFHSLNNNNSILHCKTFLELGCGHALPTCFLIQAYQQFPHLFYNVKEYTNDNDNSNNNKSSQHPFFVLSDYNTFVLREVTWPNLILNTTNVTKPMKDSTTTSSTIEESISTGIEGKRTFLSDLIVLVSGDWKDLSHHLSSTMTDEDTPMDCSSSSSSFPSSLSPLLPRQGRFDCILAAETLYTVSSTYDTAQFIVHHLTFNTGIALIATKRYYFGMGLGGGTHVFLSILNTMMTCIDKEENDNDDDTSYNTKIEYYPKVETVYVNEEGTVRDVLKVQLVPRSHSY